VLYTIVILCYIKIYHYIYIVLIKYLLLYYFCLLFLFAFLAYTLVILLARSLYLILFFSRFDIWYCIIGIGANNYIIWINYIICMALLHLVYVHPILIMMIVYALWCSATSIRIHYYKNRKLNIYYGNCSNIGADTGSISTILI
jgi:hypothetical protein